MKIRHLNFKGGRFHKKGVNIKSMQVGDDKDL